MKMKYFRFLYGETTACMIHFGEIKDTCNGENLTFLFLRGMDGQDCQEEWRQVPFLYPDSVDLVVLGNLCEPVLKTWTEMRKHVRVKTLIVPDGENAEKIGFDAAEEVIRLNSVEMKSNPGMSAEIIRQEKAEEAVKNCRYQWNITAAGWKLRVICWKEGSLALWHDLDVVSENVKITDKKEIGKFDDCVMSMKAIENSGCCESEKPDEYGCALGCVLRRDYDVCKFRYENGANPYLTGTLLTAGAESAEEMYELIKWLDVDMTRIRFFAMQNLNGECRNLLNGMKNQEPGMRRYFIGMSRELRDEDAAELCRAGFGISPIILRKGVGVCCSGLLKYSEEQES